MKGTFSANKIPKLVTLESNLFCKYMRQQFAQETFVYFDSTAERQVDGGREEEPEM